MSTNESVNVSRKPVYVLYCKAVHNVYGNPRRLYVVLFDDEKYVVFNEGYAGIKALPEKYHNLPRFTVNITVSEYNDLIRGE